ncbi:hypothetical protein EJ03DRAFT_326701 [Teratosphaeria nubilosa]|uniref:Uncharacterized protein n=1 Tax=Teratosphaeria nubilosa TaxID=161662 RepID=A0A6G1LBK0_9PEZI|nr:hypothetical protein EJ03DRAFT_326701 [Teratosphaeria nubilosa]
MLSGSSCKSTLIRGTAGLSGVYQPDALALLGGTSFLKRMSVTRQTSVANCCRTWSLAAAQQSSRIFALPEKMCSGSCRRCVRSFLCHPLLVPGLWVGCQPLRCDYIVYAGRCFGHPQIVQSAPVRFGMPWQLLWVYRKSEGCLQLSKEGRQRSPDAAQSRKLGQQCTDLRHAYSYAALLQ